MVRLHADENVNALTRVMCRPRECPRLEEIRGNLGCACASIFQRELYNQRPDISHPSSDTRTRPRHGITITMDAAYNLASFMIQFLSLLWLGHENYIITTRLRERRRSRGGMQGVGMARKRGSIERERGKENECMTPAYCARSNDIRDIIPASRECLLTLDVVLEILSSYCTLSSNTVLIKLVKGEPRPLLRPLDDVYTFSSHSLREIVAVSLLFFPSMKPAIDGALSYVFVGEPRTDCHGRVRLQRR